MNENVETVSVKVYNYPANTVPGEPPATEELLMKQQREIDESLKRKRANEKKFSGDFFTPGKVEFVFIVLVIALSTVFAGLLFLSWGPDESKNITDNVADRVVVNMQSDK